MAVVAVVVAATAAGGVARAEGIPLGPFEFFPSVSVEVGRNSNVFNRPEQLENQVPGFNPVIADSYIFLRAPLGLRLPFRQSHWDLVYTPGWNDYQNEDLDGYTHELETELELNFSSGAQFTFQGGILLDYLNSQAFDPGGEVRFSDTDFRLSELLFEYEHPLSLRHGFRSRLRWEDLDFEETQGNAFDDFTTRELGLSYLNFLGPATTLFVDAVVSRNDQERILLEVDEGEWSRDALQIGLDHRFDDRNRTRFHAGYEEMKFENSDDSDFSGVVGRFAYERLLSAAVSLQAELLRLPSQSVFNVNNYYVTDRASVSSLFRPRGRMFYVLAVSYQRNAYPDVTREFCRDDSTGVILPDPQPPGDTVCDMGTSPATGLTEDSIGIRREDFLLRWVAGIGVQFSRTTALQLNYEYVDRDSNTPEVEYETDIISLEFRFGWSGDRDLI